MLINDDIGFKSEHVEFVDYTGSFPNLCRGVLTLLIDGEEVKFGHTCWDWVSGKYLDNNYDSFWSSGGGLDSDYCAYGGEWEIDAHEIPEQFRKYAKEIDEVFNENVPHGCCGGCA